MAAVESAIATVLRDPGPFEPAGTGVRIIRLKRFPHKLYFEFDEPRQHVRFLCIMHNKRKPDYWRNRATSEA